jgi:hypothetical protein
MLVSALGLLPVGTLVKLATGETAEVLGSPEARPANKPRLKIVVDARGGLLNPPRIVDLSKTDHRIEIARVISTDGWTKGLEPVEGGEADEQSQPLSNPPSMGPGEPSNPPTEAPSSSMSWSLGWQQQPPLSTRSAVPPPAPVVLLPEGATEERTVFEASPYGASDEEEAEGTQFFRREANPALQQSQSIALPERPTATGNLQNTPLPHVLVYMLDRGFTGSLVIRDPDGKAHIMFFEGGAPQRIQLSHPVALIGEELIATRQIAPPAFDACAMAARQQGVKVTDFLLQQGLVSREGLAHALRCQLLHRAEWLSKLPDETTYEFYQEFDALSSWSGDGQAVCEPLDIILAANRVWRNQSRIISTLTKLAEHQVVLHPEVDLSGLSLTPEEQALLEIIRTRPCSMPELYNQAAVSDKVVSTLLYTLLVTRQLVLPGQQKPPMRPRMVVPPAPPPVASRPMSYPQPAAPQSYRLDAAPQSIGRASMPAPGSLRDGAPISERSSAPRSMRVPAPWREDPARSPLPYVTERPPGASADAGGPIAETVPPPHSRRMPKPWVETNRPSAPMTMPVPASARAPERTSRPYEQQSVQRHDPRAEVHTGEPIAVNVSEADEPDSGEFSSDSNPSFPSFGTSPSQVVEAMGGAMPISQSTPYAPASRPLEYSTRIPAKPTAKGDLTATPMVHILVYMLDHSATGSVVLQEPEGTEHLLEFRDGAPTKIKTGRPVWLLGDMLVEEGALHRDSIEQALVDASIIEAPLGEYLVLQDYLSRDLLDAVLHEQMLRKLAAVANQPSGTSYCFYRDVSLLANWGGKVGIEIAPLRAVLATVRAWTDRNRVRGTLYKMRDRKLVLSSESDVSCLISDETALAILAAIEPGDATVMDLYRRRLADEEEVNSLVYALAVMRHFTFSAGKGPPMGSGSRRS